MKHTKKIAALAAALAGSMVFAPRVAAAQERDAAGDDGRGGPGLLWLEAQGGYQTMTIRMVEVRNEQVLVGDREASGGAVGVGGGVRLGPLRLGPRARAALLSRGDLYTLGGEISLALPIPIAEPHVEAGFGYAALDDFRGTDRSVPVFVDGYFARASGGLDVHVAPALTVGAAVGWELLGMTPPGVSAGVVSEIRDAARRNEVERAWARARDASGSGYGSSLSFSGVVGVRY